MGASTAGGPAAARAARSRRGVTLRLTSSGPPSFAARRFEQDLVAVSDEKVHADRAMRQLKAEQADM